MCGWVGRKVGGGPRTVDTQQIALGRAAVGHLGRRRGRWLVRAPEVVVGVERVGVARRSAARTHAPVRIQGGSE
jgi:hypothetical protein